LRITLSHHLFSTASSSWFWGNPKPGRMTRYYPFPRCKHIDYDIGAIVRTNSGVDNFAIEIDSSYRRYAQSECNFQGYISVTRYMLPVPGFLEALLWSDV
jgi:hypothetical protein